MKPLWFMIPLVAVIACDRRPPSAPPAPKIESVADIPTPRNVSPPVQAKSYDDGYKTGDIAGETAAREQRARAPKQRPALPRSDEVDVIALHAAGTDSARGKKWQRGFVAGFRDGFLRAAEGKR
jgi:hypothetical protein